MRDIPTWIAIVAAGAAAVTAITSYWKLRRATLQGARQESAAVLEAETNRLLSLVDASYNLINMYEASRESLEQVIHQQQERIDRLERRVSELESENHKLRRKGAVVR